MMTPLPLQKIIPVPTALVYNHTLSAAVLRTWMQLRGLSADKPRTAPFRIKKFAILVSKSPSTIYGHMAILRTLGLLSWRSVDSGTLVVSFPTGDIAHSPAFQNSRILESLSFKELFIIDNHLNHKRESTFQDSRKPENWTALGGEKIEPADSGGDARNQAAIGIYRSLMKVKPNQAQRKSILENVTDLELWYDSLEHWLTHRWSPKNLPGMLELYQRGGPFHCRYCRDQTEKTHKDIIQEMRQEAQHGKP